MLPGSYAFYADGVEAFVHPARAEERNVKGSRSTSGSGAETLKRNMDETLAQSRRHRRSTTLRAMSTEEEELFAAYVASMPPEYRGAFDLEATRAHEAVVRRREPRSTHVEIWRELSERVVAICVVADDRPGLLSRISAALVAQQIDVVSAHAYCRTREDGSPEAVDLLWIRRLPGPSGAVPPIRAKDILALGDAIDRAATSADAEASASPAPLTTGASARVRFETDDQDGSTVLTVEAVDRPGLLLAVTQALFRAGVQIIGLRATTERGSAVDRFKLADTDGTPLRRDRLFTLQIAILGAIEEGTFAPQRKSAG
jgi:[protein-PII] uridylyltransferase